MTSNQYSYQKHSSEYPECIYVVNTFSQWSTKHWIHKYAECSSLQSFSDWVVIGNLTWLSGTVLHSDWLKFQKSSQKPLFKKNKLKYDSLNSTVFTKLEMNRTSKFKLKRNH